MKFNSLYVAALAGCLFTAPAWADKNLDKRFAEIVKTDFQPNGIVGLDRLDQDETQKFCSDPDFANSKAGAKQRKKIEAANYASIKYPTDGQFLGDWKEGEKVAQSGRGLTWTDTKETVNGGNCYNCHQIDKKEISHGTIGPSLYNYGKTRGYSAEVVRYTWGRIYNAKAFNACSNMPRAGHMGVLNETQIKHLMALLLDPNSPVNQ